jgi:hypothetical protein
MMNVPFNTPQPVAAAPMPMEFETLTPPPLLLPGENLEQYQLMQQAILAEIAPRSAIEWLLAIDVVELSWDIQRYRLLRHKILQTFRQQAVERALSRIDLVGIPPSFQEEASCYTRLNALSWRMDPAAATEIEFRLGSYGLDAHSINAEVYAQARELFLMFETLLVSAQTRRTVLLREFNNQRHARDFCEEPPHQTIAFTIDIPEWIYPRMIG